MGMPDLQPLLDEINETFSSLPYPGDYGIADSNVSFSLESCGIEEAFRGKHWKELSIDFILEHCDALAFFSAAAFHFYLPAYLTQSLLHYDQADRVPGSVMFYLGSPSETKSAVIKQHFFRIRERFTPDQRKAVCHFVEFIRTSHGKDFPSTDFEATIGLWSFQGETNCDKDEETGTGEAPG